MSGVLRTPDLPRAVADYTGVLGFECRQHIPGVLAVVVHGPLQLQLWACGARPGRWEKPDPRVPAWAPTRHSVVVRHIHALHASLRQAILCPVVSRCMRTGCPLKRRPCSPGGRGRLPSRISTAR